MNSSFPSKPKFDGRRDEKECNQPVELEEESSTKLSSPNSNNIPIISKIKTSTPSLILQVDCVHFHLHDRQI